MRLIQDLKEYATKRGMTETEIDKVLEEIQSENGRITEEHYKNAAFAIDCLTANRFDPYTSIIWNINAMVTNEK